ncbi:hypothetical protein [Rufibacter psychrotolerans]|uniref:hypothetical protein n=1 Tax=Rufibacter psychrotolerans TaxID=2812556 RepID=UPI0019688EA7|nr:hypothetical protein [Rufibacter sp. SYSU D00308]
MDSPKQIIAVASRYGVVIQHTFTDLYSAIRFLRKGEREGRHTALGAFDPSNGVVYTLAEAKQEVTSGKMPAINLNYFLDLGLKASRLVIY